MRGFLKWWSERAEALIPRIYGNGMVSEEEEGARDERAERSATWNRSKYWRPCLDNGRVAISGNSTFRAERNALAMPLALKEGAVSYNTGPSTRRPRQAYTKGIFGKYRNCFIV